MEEGNITFPDLVAFELPGEIAEGLGPAGNEENPARLPVEAVDGVNSKPGITVDPLPEVRVSLDPGLKDGTEIPSLFLLNAQPGGFLHHEPTLARRQNRNGKRVRCHRKKEEQPTSLSLRVTQAVSLTSRKELEYKLKVNVPKQKGWKFRSRDGIDR